MTFANAGVMPLAESTPVGRSVSLPGGSLPSALAFSHLKSVPLRSFATAASASFCLPKPMLSSL